MPACEACAAGSQRLGAACFAQNRFRCFSTDDLQVQQHCHGATHASVYLAVLMQGAALVANHSEEQPQAGPSCIVGRCVAYILCLVPLLTVSDSVPGGTSPLEVGVETLCQLLYRILLVMLAEHVHLFRTTA